jgi:hypothetical protein
MEMRLMCMDKCVERMRLLLMTVVCDCIYL